MKLTITDMDISKLQVSEEQGATRTAGVHVSSVIRHIAKAGGLLQEGKFSEDDLEQFAIVGRLWERVLADAYYTRPRYERIGEIEKDGIIGSPDALDLEKWAVAEFKVTWVSSKEFQDRAKFRMYKWQVCAYLHMLGWVRARISVLHLRGDYTSPVPIIREYSLLFTQQELRENWAMIVSNAKAVEEKL